MAKKRVLTTTATILTILLVLLVVFSVTKIDFFKQKTTNSKGTSITAQPVSTSTQCNDGIDNDGDGLIDWSGDSTHGPDLACTGPSDDSEAGTSDTIENGWTIYEPSNNTKIFYVSNAGSDSNNGLSPATPVKTIAKGYSLLTTGKPEWLLLKRGDQFNESIIWAKSGSNQSARMIFGTYGTSTERAWINGNWGGACGGCGGIKQMVVMGMKFLKEARDPDSPNYINGTPSQAIGSLGGLTNFLMEDNELKYDMLIIQAYNNPVTNITIRRNVIHHTYTTSGHQQAFYMEAAPHPINHVRIDENMFDHGGWHDTLQNGTVFNHDIYISAAGNVTEDIEFDGNIIANGSDGGLMARTGGNITNNLFVGNAGDLNCGFVNGQADKVGGVECYIIDNTFLGLRTLNGIPQLGAMQIANVKRGLIKGNIISNDPVQSHQAIGFAIGSGVWNLQDAVGINNLTFEDNKIYNWKGGIGVSPAFINGPGHGNLSWNNVEFRDNDFQISSGATIIDHQGALDTQYETWSGNDYYSTASVLNWFKVQGTTKILSAWLGIDTTGRSVTHNYVDPNRTLSTYMTSLGRTGTSFMNEADKQSKYNWHDEYTAGAVNDYIREGFQEQGSATNYTWPAVYSLLTSAGAGGTINPNGITYFLSGTSMGVTITPNVGYQIMGIVIDGASQTILKSSYAFQKLQANKTVSASFGLNGTNATCGNGAVESGEQCDDGNTNNNDGCSSTCRYESFSLNFTGNTTNLTTITNLSNVQNFQIQNPTKGMIKFIQALNFLGSSTTVNLTQLAQKINQYIIISPKSISVDSQNLQVVNSSATLTLYGLTETNPKILMDGTECPPTICQIQSYSGGVLVFNVSHFTNYTIEEDNTTTSNSTTDNSTNSSSGSSSSSSSSTSSSSGGGGGGGGGSSNGGSSKASNFSGPSLARSLLENLFPSIRDQETNTESGEVEGTGENKSSGPSVSTTIITWILTIIILVMVVVIFVLGMKYLKRRKEEEKAYNLTQTQEGVKGNNQQQ